MCQREKKPDASCLPHTNFFFLLFELLFFIKHLNVKFKIIKKKQAKRALFEEYKSGYD